MTKRTEISELGEFGLIQRLSKGNTKHSGTIKSIGDDCAVIDAKPLKTLVTTDFLLEDIHFDLSYTPLKHLGYKAVVVNVSDIYAMNGTPKHITVSIAVSNRFSVEALEEIYAGIYLACENYGIDVIGGDTTSSPKGLIISITAIGEAAEDKIVYRNQAKEGDLICVTGNLGAAYLGLQILIREKQVYLEDPNMKPEITEENSYLIERILKPEAKKKVIDYFKSENILPHAMIDISDGLSSELMHICSQSKVGCLIEEKEIPIDQTAYDQAMKFNLDPTVCALSGGEDYELLFTIDPKDREKIIQNEGISIIGLITKPEDGLKLESRSGNTFDLKAQGWVSF
jgi:thiamine-monophosphate kinase